MIWYITFAAVLLLLLISARLLFIKRLGSLRISLVLILLLLCTYLIYIPIFLENYRLSLDALLCWVNSIINKLFIVGLFLLTVSGQSIIRH